jgi:hypothetical protein
MTPREPSAAGPSDAGRFAVDDRVRVLHENPEGNPRTPAYIRGREGVVTRLHGVVVNPLDHADPYTPLYTVRFVLPSGSGGPTELCVDLHDDALEPLVQVSAPEADADR